MSHAVRLSATRTSSPPHASAAILHFDCLYTHDLRRKHKRWQDGQLKFHTFNEKYMVYNDGGGFVGDGHWAGDLAEFCEGLELSLDRGAAIVQVDRCTGRTEQDLSQLLDKRAKEVEMRRLNAASRVSNIGTRTPVPEVAVGGASNVDRTVRHRPLSNLVSDSGPIGRAALPERSLFEEKNALSSARPRGDRAPAPRPESERRGIGSPPTQEGHAQKLFGTKLTLVNTPLPPRSVPSLSHANESPPPGSSDGSARNRAEKNGTPSLAQDICPRATSARADRNLAKKLDVNRSRATPKRQRVQEKQDDEDSSHTHIQMHDLVEPQQSPRGTREKRPRLADTNPPRSIHTRKHSEVDAQERPEARIVPPLPGDGTAEDDKARSKPVVQRSSEECQTKTALTDAPSHFSTERRIQLRSKPKPKRGLLILSEMSDKAAGDPEINGRTFSDDNPQVVSGSEGHHAMPADEPEDFLVSPPATKRKMRTGARGEGSGPRMKRMARKSVKSKEIFGLALPANEPIPSPFVSPVDAPRAGPNCQVGTFPVRVDESSSSATKEKAAAGHDDAARPVPRSTSVCGSVTVIPGPFRLDAGVETDSQSPLKSPISIIAEPKSMANPLIGGGGAWSRHAEDLLGMTRPIMKARC